MTRTRHPLRVVVVGTGTDVGKTWVGAAVLTSLRSRGLQVSARKLVQSFDPGDSVESRDANILALATGESPETVCPASLSLGVALAPPMAATQLGVTPPSKADLLKFAAVGEECNVVFFETAGGLRSPQASDADAIDLCVALEPDVVLLISDSILGTLSNVRLCHEVLERQLEKSKVFVVLNDRSGNGELFARNVNWLRDVDSFDVYDASELDGVVAYLEDESSRRNAREAT